MSENRPLARKVGITLAAASMLSTTGAACSSDDGGDDTAASDDTNASNATAADGDATFVDLGDNEAITTTEYVGAIAGTEIYAAFAVTRDNETDEVVGGEAYFCDGETVANWFGYPVDGEGLTFRSGSTGDSFTGEIDDDGNLVVAGVPLGGESYDVTAEEVDADGEAGLFLADAAIDADLATDERAGWIVLTDGTQRGAVRAGRTIQPGSTLQAGSTQVAVGGRDIMLRAITEIIGLDKK